jgi:hypothetical protein
VATRGTAAYLRAHGLDVDIIFKVNEGRPHVGDELLNRRIALVINTPLGRESFFDDRAVRSAAMLQGVPAITTLTGAAAAVSAIAALRKEGMGVKSLQEYYGEAKTLFHLAFVPSIHRSSTIESIRSICGAAVSFSKPRWTKFQHIAAD